MPWLPALWHPGTARCPDSPPPPRDSPPSPSAQRWGLTPAWAPPFSRRPRAPLSPARAGGSAKQARDRRTQAILPLRGKIINVERQDEARLYQNSEISALIVGLGLGIKGEEGLAGLRYGKVGARGRCGLVAC